MITKEQKRAAYALENIQILFNNLNKETANFLVGLPTMILVNGLGQSMAFLLSKKDKDMKYENGFIVIKNWLIKEDNNFNTQDEKDFLKKFTDLEPIKYINLQKEVLAMLLWLKRYARAFQQPETQEE